MDRPDEKLFLQCVEHFQVIDAHLENFCLEQGFMLDKNLYRTPCRVLRKRGNPELIIDIYQEDDWLTVGYSDELPHTFALAGYYEPTANSSYLYKLENVLIEKVTFDEIVTQLQSYLDKGLETLHSWTLEKFQIEGAQVENLKRTFVQ